jgi:hypothetical protein
VPVSLVPREYNTIQFHMHDFMFSAFKNVTTSIGMNYVFTFFIPVAGTFQLRRDVRVG